MIVGIANIMLANNICDLEEDIANKRHTLPYYIGKKNAIILFQILTYIAYVWIVIGVLFKILPVVSLLVFVTIVPVKRHLEAFKKNQEKDKTFICAVKNFVLISMVYLLTIFLGVVIQRVIH
jgi:1,4-dihydroxy-2-naphthoate octaprenyltransferase